MKYKTDMPTYLRLKQCLSEIYPQVEVMLLSSDPILKELGFAETVPCKIELNMTKEQRNEIRDLTIQFEADAVDKPENSAAYKDYCKYGWLFNFL